MICGLVFLLTPPSKNYTFVLYRLYCLPSPMDKNKISQALTAGLLAGYGGKTEFHRVNRGSFELKSSHFEDGDIVYHDEWSNGGGQEIIKVDGEMFTRVYAGGVLGDSKEVIPKLIFFIQKLSNKTRLFSDCQLTDGDWQYQYKIIDSDSGITTGKETIKFQNQIVFIHIFVLSPIKQ